MEEIAPCITKKLGLCTGNINFLRSLNSCGHNYVSDFLYRAGIWYSSKNYAYNF